MFDIFEYLNIVDKDTMEKSKDTDKAVGTVSVQVRGMVSGAHILFSRNAAYWQSVVHS